MYGYVSESVVCLLELAYEYMNPNLGKNRGSRYMHCEHGLAERADFHRVRTYGAALSEGLALREMASPLGLPSLYANNCPSR